MATQRGYTLVEMLVAMAIIAVLLALLFPIFKGAMGKAHEAKCITQLQQISQALGQYKLDNGVYPEPDDPMATLVAAKVSKSLAGVLTCPRDPADGHDTYGAFYNYWGYYPGTGQPSPIPSRAEAKSTYKTLLNPATGQPDYWYPIPTDSPAPPNIDPDADGPNSAFPGLANAAAPPATIVTVCPHHLGGRKGKYLVLRLTGDARPVSPPRDEDFWRLSRP